ncbi:MAG: hypothetical protein Q9221_000677 [Calogaya cf. arnoldii]
MAFRVPSKRRWASSSRSSTKSTPTQTRRLSHQQPVRRVQHRDDHVVPSTSSSSRFGALPPDKGPLSAIHVEAGFTPEQDSDINEREEDDSLNEVVMAVDLRDRGTVGCAYYIAREEKLYMMQDLTSGGIDIVELLKLHAQPTVILLSTKSDENVSIRLDPTGGSLGSVAGDGR